MNKLKKRGFEVVIDKHREHKDVEIQLPRRATSKSSGYDMFSPIEVSILPNESIIISSDIKAYMLDDEELLIFPRSSLGLKKGLVIKNTIGKIDSDYYSCEENDGNIKISIWTGYTFEELLNFHDAELDLLLTKIDILIDGKFIKEKK